MIFNEARSPDSADSTPLLGPFASASHEVFKPMTRPEEQSHSTSERSLSRRDYVPLRPKPPSKSESPLTGILQGPSRPPQLSSDEALAFHTTSHVARGKRKRSLSPRMLNTNIPGNFLCVFQSGATKNEPQQLPIAKKRKSAKTCLRCQRQKLAVRSLLTLIQLG